jgi:hypothetical protein
LGVAAWLVILLPGAVVVAAFSNDAQMIVSFLRWTRDDVIGEAWKTLGPLVTDYFKAYVELGKWLVGENR